MRKKDAMLFAVIIAVASLISACTQNSAHPVSESLLLKKTDSLAQGQPGIAVVELFTSEGCSSCPPADKLFSMLPGLFKSDSDRIYLISFHVDYWNYLGWTDRFSDELYSDRQRNYCQALNSTVYTPQMIINGTEPVLGSDKAKVEQAIKDAMSINSQNAIQASGVLSENKKSIKIYYDISGDISERTVNAALLEKNAQSDVSRGENMGKNLHHINIVRDFKSEDAKKSGSIEFKVPVGLDEDNMSIIVFTQRKTELLITGASSVTTPAN